MFGRCSLLLPAVGVLGIPVQLLSLEVFFDDLVRSKWYFRTWQRSGVKNCGSKNVSGYSIEFFRSFVFHRSPLMGTCSIIPTLQYLRRHCLH
jgi:hypothetical protein